MGTEAEYQEYLQRKAARTKDVDWSWCDEAGNRWTKPSDILTDPALSDPRPPWLRRRLPRQAA
jgi:hypothetical protein